MVLIDLFAFIADIWFLKDLKILFFKQSNLFEQVVLKSGFSPL